MEKKRKVYEYEIDKRYARERKATYAQYKKITDTTANLGNATIFSAIFVAVFAIMFFPQVGIPIIATIMIIYSGASYIAIALYHNKKVRELLKQG